MTMRRSLWTLGLAAALVAAPASAQDKPTPAATAQAREHFNRGVKLYEEDDFRTALIEFKRAYELAPNPTLLFNIGNSYYQLREYADALRTLEQYVREVGNAIPKEQRAQVDRELEELRGRVARVTFQGPAGAELSMDDTKLGTLPLSPNQIISAGRHRLTVTKPGFKPTTKDVDIAGGDTLTIPFDLKHEDAPASPAPSADVERRPSHAASITAFSIGAIGLAVGVVGGIGAISAKSDLDDQCSGKTCPRSAEDDLDAFDRNGVLSTVGFAVGAAGLLAGGIFWYVESSRTKEQARRTVRVGLGGPGIVGRF